MTKEEADQHITALMREINSPVARFKRRLKYRLRYLCDVLYARLHERRLRRKWTMWATEHEVVLKWAKPFDPRELAMPYVDTTKKKDT